MLRHQLILILLATILSTSLYASTVETDLLLNHKLAPQIDQDKNNCTNCSFFKPETLAECPKAIEYLIQQTLSPTIYNYVTGKKLLDTCLTSTSASDAPNNHINEKLSDLLDQKFSLSEMEISSCLSQNNITFNQNSISKKEATNTITGYFHSLHKNIFENQISLLKKISLIDQLLGNSPLKNFQCDHQFEKHCQEIKACKNNNTTKSIATFSLKALKEIIALKKQLKNLSTLKNQNKISDDDQLKIKNDISAKIKMINDLMPWMNGDDLSANTEKITKNLEENKPEIAENIFTQNFTKQLSKAKDILKENYFQGNIAINCLTNSSACSTQTLQNLNSFMKKSYAQKSIPTKNYSASNEKSRQSYLEAQSLNQALRSGFCVSELLNQKHEIDESAKLVASTGISLMVGGFGGVMPLAESAMTFYQIGNRLKGLSSLALLAIDGASLNQSYSDIAKECQKSVKHLEQTQPSSNPNQISCNSESLNFNVSELSPCFENIALTTFPYLLSLKITKIIPFKKGEQNLPQEISPPAPQAVTHNQKPTLVENFINNRLDQYEKLRFEFSKRKLIKMGKSDKEAEAEAATIAKNSKEAFRERYYACQAKTFTPELRSALKRYTALSSALSIGSTAFGYYTNNKEKFAQEKKEFFGQLSYEVTMSYLLSKINSKLASPVNTTFTQRYIDGNINGAQIGVLDAAVYSHMFGISEDEAKLKIEEITHSKDAQKDLKILDAYINKKNLVEKFETQIIENYLKILNSPDKKILLSSSSENTNIESFSHLSKEDLQKPEIKEKLVKAVMEEMNSGSANAILSLGDKGADRWAMNRIWGLTVGAPRAIIVGTSLMKMLCLGADYPLLSLGMATSLQIMNSLIGNDVYYQFKKELIGI